jgi:hypothetical protein
MKTLVTARQHVDGSHYWKNAPPEVSFLASPHRHSFGVEIVINVCHDDRDVEFFIVNRMARIMLDKKYPKDLFSGYEFGGSSCEMIAEYLFKEFDGAGIAVDMVTVQEDDESFATVIRGE